MGKSFRAWNPEQRFLLPPAIDEFVEPGHLAHFVRELVRESLDLSAIVDSYQEERGNPPYHPGDDDSAAFVRVLSGSVLLAPDRAGVRRAGGFHGGDGAESA